MNVITVSAFRKLFDLSSSPAFNKALITVWVSLGSENWLINMSHSLKSQVWRVRGTANDTGSYLPLPRWFKVTQAVSIYIIIVFNQIETFNNMSLYLEPFSFTNTSFNLCILAKCLTTVPAVETLKSLVSSCLTSWQFSLLHKGKFEGFFLNQWLTKVDNQTLRSWFWACSRWSHKKQ